MKAPTLKFCNDHEVYNSDTLIELVKVSGGATPLKANKLYWENGTIPWLSSQEIGSRFVSEGTYTITELAITDKTTRMVEKGTILMVTRSGILARKVPLSITKTNLAINQDIKALIPKSNHLSSTYLYYWLKKNEFILLNKIVKTGTTVQSINLPDLEKLCISYPNITIQNKIADFFTLLDHRIEKQQEKVEAWRKYKKGMVQKLFSQELRFKDEDGKEFPKWDSKHLKNLGEFKKSYSYSRALEGEGDYKHIHYGDIHTKYNGILGYEVDFPNISVDGPLETLEENDVVFADASEDYKDLGKAVVVCGIINKKVVAGLHTHRFSPAKDIDSRYLMYYTKSKEYEKFVRKYGTGVSVLGLSKSNLSSLVVPIPHLDEQNKIADLLSKIDNKILKEDSRLDILTEEKKGFMQQMFI